MQEHPVVFGQKICENQPMRVIDIFGVVYMNGDILFWYGYTNRYIRCIFVKHGLFRFKIID